MGITSRLASFVAETPLEAIPADVQAIGRRIILDTLGNAIAGTCTTGSRRMLDTVRGWGGPPEASVLGSDLKVSRAFAAFANTMLACALEADDTVANIGHIGHCSLMPGLALGEAADADGRALLLATILAYETGARIGLAGRSVVRKDDGRLDFGNTGVGSNWVIFSAALSAARMLGLDTERTAWSLGIAGTAASIPTGRRWNRPGWNNMKYNAYALMAQSATQGAMLAANGFTGDPDILDGDPREVKANWWSMAGFPAHDGLSAVDRLGDHWVMRETAFKPYPSCRFTHGLLDGLIALLGRHAINADAIDAIDCYTGRTLFTFKMHLPDVSSDEDAQFSTPHVLAMAALGVPPGPEWVAERWWRDAAVAQLKAKITCHVSDEANAAVIEQIVANRFERFPWRIVVSARGERFEAAGDYAAGDAFTEQTRWGDAEVEAKFRGFTAGLLSSDAATDCVERILRIERGGSVREITATLNGRLRT